MAAQPGLAAAAGGAMSAAETKEEPEDLISSAELMKLLQTQADDEVASDDLDAAEPLPNVTRMPEGIEVVERRLGHAVGYWVLQVRCDCGRRWFEVEAVTTADCPRCGALVLVDVESR